MTEYTAVVERQRRLIELEKWSKKITYILGTGGMVETKFNNGDIHYQETKKGGKAWTVEAVNSTEDLFNDMDRRGVDARAGFDPWTD